LERGHPDILIFEPPASIGINQIRQLQKKLALKPYSANLKVALLTSAEKLTLPAQNALLKTLEEPPAKSLIILTTAKSALLLPTIVSRCQLIKLPVKTEIKLDREALNNQQSIINNILKSGAGERLQQAEKLAKNRDQAINFCQNQLWLWRKILLARINSSPKQKISLNYQQIIQTLKTIRSTLKLFSSLSQG
jgi:DNA polymerase-3 subunit delta'